MKVFNWLVSTILLLSVYVSAVHAQTTPLSAKPLANTNLVDAIRNDDVDVLKHYLDGGGNPNAKVDGRTLIFYAVTQRSDFDFKGLKLLLQRGADPNQPNKSTSFPLLEATDTYHLGDSPFELLLQHKANVNQKTSSGFTTLMGLSSPSQGRFTPMNIALMKLIMARGADVNTRNSSGFSALDIADDDGFNDISSFLRQHGAKVLKPTETLTNRMQTLLQAVRLKDTSMLIALLSKTQFGVVYTNLYKGSNQYVQGSFTTYTFSDEKENFLHKKGSFYGDMFPVAAEDGDAETTFYDCVNAVAIQSWKTQPDGKIINSVKLSDPNPKGSKEIYAKWKVQAGHWVVQEFGYPRHQM